MALNKYIKGACPRLKATFADAAGAAIDPTTITLKVKDPSGTVTTYTYAAAEVTRSATGIYYKDVTMNTSGVWWYRFESTGTCIAAGEETLEVEDSAF